MALTDMFRFRLTLTQYISLIHLQVLMKPVSQSFKAKSGQRAHSSILDTEVLGQS